MTKFLPLMIIVYSTCLALAMSTLSPAAEPRQVTSLDRDWRFHLGDVGGAEKPEVSTADWRVLDVPHDFSIEGPKGSDPSTMEGPFDRKSPAGAGGGYLNGGTAWYRKTFTLPAADQGKVVLVEFDGVYMDSDVWLNGQHLGKHPYGYTSFFYNISKKARYGQPNELAVRVVVQQPCSRWYSGGGIYRHVRLVVADPVHVAHWGTYVTTPQVAIDAAGKTTAQVRVRTRVRNASPVSWKVALRTAIVDRDGREVAQAETEHGISADDQFEFDQTIPLADAHRWSIEDPYLYKVVSEVIQTVVGEHRVGKRVTDRVTNPLGVRTFQFTADKGMLLNDKRVPLYGVCDHHDLGCLGSAVNTRALERQLEILKSMGCNAIRTSHNPPTPELLDLCDRMGFVVMDEAFDEWKAGKTHHGYGRFFDEWSEKDLVSMIHRDRNHPSVILWSIGNEIHEQGAKNGHAMAQRLADICHREDPTRPVTSACNNPKGALKSGYAKALDVFGINYHGGEYNAERGKVLVGSETASALSSRGEYNVILGKDGQLRIEKTHENQCTSYDLMHPGWGCVGEVSLKALKAAPWVAGEFVWTGFDYIGEPTPFKWPSRSSYFGIIDLAGFPKDRFYLYQSQWTDKPVVHLLPHWNWKGFEGNEIPVWCFTNAESVELFLNGKSLGAKDFKGTDAMHLEWKVAYEPGVLKAVGRRGGKTIAEDEVFTAGQPARLVLAPDRREIRADGVDLSFVEVRIVDKDGHTCPNADNKITFKTEGPGAIVGVDNGDATNHEPFKAREHKAYHGLALAVIQSARQPGSITVTATTPGLPPATATIAVQAGE